MIRGVVKERRILVAWVRGESGVEAVPPLAQLEHPSHGAWLANRNKGTLHLQKLAIGAIDSFAAKTRSQRSCHTHQQQNALPVCCRE